MEAATNDQDEVEETMEFPLFMTDLPKNFAENAALSALGSLLDDNQEDEHNKKHDDRDEESKTTPLGNLTSSDHMDDDSICCQCYEANAGGGKAKRTKTRDRRATKTAPYGKTPRPQRNSKAAPSIGESMLFLKLWKL